MRAICSAGSALLSCMQSEASSTTVVAMWASSRWQRTQWLSFDSRRGHGPAGLLPAMTIASWLLPLDWDAHADAAYGSDEVSGCQRVQGQQGRHGGWWAPCWLRATCAGVGGRSAVMRVVGGRRGTWEFGGGRGTENLQGCMEGTAST